MSLKEIQKKLTRLQYDVTQNADTEHPYSSSYDKLNEEGIYVDIITGQPLFCSRDKYDAGCGWPSFTKPIDKRLLSEYKDTSHGLNRVEVRAKRSDSHLGHVFEDGPKEEGLRYCINGASLRFVAKEDLKKEGYGYLLKLFD